MADDKVVSSLTEGKSIVTDATADTRTPKESTSWVELNVGGKMLLSKRETLIQYQDSQLAKMVNSTKDGDVLRLDLDSEYFGPILNWLR